MVLTLFPWTELPWALPHTRSLALDLGLAQTVPNLLAFLRVVMGGSEGKGLGVSFCP